MVLLFENLLLQRYKKLLLRIKIIIKIVFLQPFLKYILRNVLIKLFEFLLFIKSLT